MWYQTGAGTEQGHELCLGTAQGAEPGPAQDEGQCLGLQNLASSKGLSHHPPSTHTLALSLVSAGFRQAAIKSL